jgi:two-component system sensor kinase FixL
MSETDDRKPQALAHEDRELLEARARAILESARDAIITIDEQGQIVEFNRAAEAMFGYSNAEILGTNVKLLMPSPYREEHDSYIEEYERTGVKRAIGKIRDVYAQRKCGETFPIELAVSEVSSSDHRIYTAIIRDVSAYRAATEELRREKEFSERLIEATPFIVLVLNADARVSRFNRAMSDITGYGSDEASDADWLETFIPERERDRVSKIFASAASGKRVRGNVNAILTKSGEERTIRWFAEPLFRADGEVDAVLCSGEDITEEVRAKSEIRRLEQLTTERERLAELGAIAAGLVHDLGNPISGLTMQVDRLVRRSQTGDESDILQPIQRIVAATDRLSTLVRGFMDFARERRLDSAEIDLVALVRTVAEFLGTTAVQDAVGIDVESETDPLVLRGDETQLRRVFENLVKNAAEAMQGRDGRIVVRLEEVGTDRIRVTVRDDGPGVADGTDVFRLFETTKPSGTGIGLAVAKQIVLAHGGSIEQNNREVGGSDFVVELPIAGTPS